MHWEDNTATSVRPRSSMQDNLSSWSRILKNIKRRMTQHIIQREKLEQSRRNTPAIHRVAYEIGIKGRLAEQYTSADRSVSLILKVVDVTTFVQEQKHTCLMV